MRCFILTIDLAPLPGDPRQQRAAIANALRRVASMLEHGQGGTTAPGLIYGDSAREIGTYRFTEED